MSKNHLVEETCNEPGAGWMEKAGFQNVLVVGRQGTKIYELVKILAEFFPTITRIEGPDDRPTSCASDNFGLIVITDSLNRKINENLFSSLRRSFPSAKIIGLFDNLNQETEVSLRRAGVIYLGSYERFKKNYPAILHAAL